MAKIAFLSLVFPPDNVSTAHLMGGIASALCARGHDVTVVTTTPHYNHDPIAESAQPRTRRLGGVAYESRYKGVRVLHLAMPRKSPKIPARLASWAWFSGSSALAALAWAERPDVVIAPSPPLTMGLSAWAMARAARVPFVYNVQEIYPDVAVSLGALRNRRAIAALERVEAFIYDRAAAVTVIGPGMRRRLLEKGVPVGKVHVVPNFVDLDEVRPSAKDNSFSREHGVHDRFVVSYAGNLGPAQGLDCFVRAAGHLRDDPAVTPLIIGAGGEYEKLLALSRECGARTLRFAPHQPYSRVPEIYAATDVCLVAQGKGTGPEALPSKVYRILAAGRPVLACTDVDSDLAEIVRESGAGRVVAAGDDRGLADAMREAAREPAAWEAMGSRGREYVRERFSLDAVAGMYDGIVQGLV